MDGEEWRRKDTVGKRYSTRLSLMNIIVFVFMFQVLISHVFTDKITMRSLYD